MAAIFLAYYLARNSDAMAAAALRRRTQQKESAGAEPDSSSSQLLSLHAPDSAGTMYLKAAEARFAKQAEIAPLPLLASRLKHLTAQELRQIPNHVRPYNFESNSGKRCLAATFLPGDPRLDLLGEICAIRSILPSRSDELILHGAAKNPEYLRVAAIVDLPTPSGSLEKICTS